MVGRNRSLGIIVGVETAWACRGIWEREGGDLAGLEDSRS
jgi:hypothetical protein